jgi:GTP-binding protein Era
MLNKQAYYSATDVDVILFLVDASMSLGKGDMFVLDKLKEKNKPVILVINKIDKITHDDILLKINEYKDLYDFAEIVPVSAIKKNNVDDLVKTIKKYLTDEIPYYGKNDITNKPLTFSIAELVREKVFELTDQEVPHSITCVVADMKKDKNAYFIIVDIIVDRDNLKNIIIGKQGRMVKEIGIRARKDIEELLGKKVYLETYVKTIKKWRDKEKYLQEFGFTDFE